MTRLKATFPMGNKAQILINFKRYVVCIHNRGCNSHALRPDHGTEYESNTITDLQQVNGITTNYLEDRLTHSYM